MTTTSRFAVTHPNKFRANTAAVVLAGTHAWEPGGFDTFTPRSLVPVLNVPLILHTLNWLGRSGISTVILCVNQEGHRFRKLFGNGDALQMDLYYQEDHLPRGPAGCVLDASLTVDADRFVVVEANSIHLVDLDELLNSHKRSGEYGTVVIAKSEQGKPWEEKSDRPAGIYVFEREILSQIPICGYIDIKEGLIPELYRLNRYLNRFDAERYSPRVYDTASYLQINHWALNELCNNSPASQFSSRRGTALLEADVRVAESARIVGPCLIGRQTRIGEGATIVGPAVVGRNCSIGAGALVHNCVMWDRAEVVSGTVATGLFRGER